MKYLYNRAGDAVAVLEGDFLFGLDGYAVGFVQGTQVFKMNGSWVGEIHQDMVVDTLSSNPGPSTPPANPGRIPPPERIPGRGPMDYGYPSRIEGLFD